MNQHTVHEYLMKKPLVMITQPFGQDVDVYKVNHKMFATLAEGKEGQTDDEGNLVWWLIFPSVIPGYHMNKRLWNTVILDGTVPQGEIERMIDNSFDLVVANMPEKDRKAIELHL